MSYRQCGGGIGSGYATKIVPRKEKGNGASFIVEPHGCYDIYVTLRSTDGSEAHADAVRLQMEGTEPKIEVVGCGRLSQN